MFFVNFCHQTLPVAHITGGHASHLERQHDVAGQQIVVAVDDGGASRLASCMNLCHLAFQVCQVPCCKTRLLLLVRHPQLPCTLQPDADWSQAW